MKKLLSCAALLFAVSAFNLNASNPSEPTDKGKISVESARADATVNYIRLKTSSKIGSSLYSFNTYSTYPVTSTVTTEVNLEFRYTDGTSEPFTLVLTIPRGASESQVLEKSASGTISEFLFRSATIVAPAPAQDDTYNYIFTNR